MENGIESIYTSKFLTIGDVAKECNVPLQIGKIEQEGYSKIEQIRNLE